MILSSIVRSFTASGQILQIRISIVDIATVAERIQDTERGFQRSVNIQNVTPCIIGVRYDHVAVGTVHQRHYVTLKILDIVIEFNGGRTL